MYTTPAIRPVPMDTQTSSCCTITLYSEALGQTFVIRNPGCGTIVKQFPTCGDIAPGSGTGISTDPVAVVSLPRSGPEAVLATANEAAAAVRNALPVDLCVVSVSTNVSPGVGAMSLQVSGV